MKFVFDPKGKGGYILFGDFLFIFVLFLLFSFALLDSFEDSAHIIGRSFNVNKFKAFVGTHVIEDDLFDVAVCDQNGNFGFGEGVDMRILSCEDTAWCSTIEDDILCGFLFGDVIFQAEKSIFSVEFVSVQIDNIVFEILVHAAFLEENGKIFKPVVVRLRIFFSFIFQHFDNSFGQESPQFSNQSSILISLP